MLRLGTSAAPFEFGRRVLRAPVQNFAGGLLNAIHWSGELVQAHSAGQRWRHATSREQGVHLCLGIGDTFVQWNLDDLASILRVFQPGALR